MNSHRPPLDASDPGRARPLCAEVAAASSELLVAPDKLALESDASEFERLARLRAHVAECPGCSAAQAVTAAWLATLRELPAPPADPRRITALRAALAEPAPARGSTAFTRGQRKGTAPRSKVAPLEWAALLTAALVLAGALLRYSPTVARLFAHAPSGGSWLLPLLFLGAGSVLSLIALPLLRGSLLHATVGAALPPGSP